MKPILILLSVLFLTLSSISTAHAAVCARGAYRAGCAGPHGSVVRRPNGSVVVRKHYHPPHRHCVRRANGTVVCR